jgi:hypothetical protein
MSMCANPRQYRQSISTRDLACLVLGAFSGVLHGCGIDAEPPQLAVIRDAGTAPVELTPEQKSRVEAFCGDCHALPRPESRARDRWHDGVRKGYEFYAKSGRNDLDPPPPYQTLAYYRSRAPQSLQVPASQDAPGEPGVTFRQESLPIESVPGVLPEISHLQWVRLAPIEAPVLLACDMRYGQLLAIDLHADSALRRPPRVLARLRNPARAEVCDLDGDGLLDVVVADLGSYLPVDHDRGRVVLLRRRAGAEAYDEIELVSGLGRVADVRTADMDGDGRLDVVVAEFGWRETGCILLLRNISSPGEPLRFDRSSIDDRPGAIHVPVHDFTGDGRPDFAALVSQEYESVDVFVNRGQTHFVRAGLWEAPDLTFGSSGMELVDLNADGRMDILMTNGDAFDDAWVSPWHGVQWLENSGGPEFVYHRITDLPGAYRALAADFDGAVAWLPPNVQPPAVKESASIVFLEQTTPGEFSRYALESGAAHYATLAVDDFDGDGRPDFVVASGPRVATVRRLTEPLTVWWNETPVRATARTLPDD